MNFQAIKHQAFTAKEHVIVPIHRENLQAKKKAHQFLGPKHRFLWLSWFILHIISASCFVLDVPCWIILELQCNRKNKEELEKRECYKN